MNEKLTSKQPEMVTITEEHWKDFQQLVVNNANLEKENKELKQLLTALTTEDEGCEKCKGTGEYTDNGLDYLTCDCVVGCPPDYVAVRHDMKTIQKAYNDITLRKIEEVAPTPSEQRQWTLYDFAQKLQQEV